MSLAGLAGLQRKEVINARKTHLLGKFKHRGDVQILDGQEEKGILPSVTTARELGVEFIARVMEFSSGLVLFQGFEQQPKCLYQGLECSRPHVESRLSGNHAACWIIEHSSHPVLLSQDRG